MTKEIAYRLQKIRDSMDVEGVDAYVVPRADEYLGEYVPPQNERLQWISGFTGSAGTAVVLKDSAAIFTDGRYTIQVRQQVPEDCYEFHHLIEEPPIKWLAAALDAGQTVGVDSRMHSLSWYEASTKTLEAAGIKLVELGTNPIDEHWDDRPVPEQKLAMLLDESYTGEHSEHKRRRIGEAISEAGGDIALISQLDSIAWLLNIRGLDVPRLPVLLSFATLRNNGDMTLFTDPRKLPNDFTAHVGSGVTVREFGELEDELADLGATGSKILADPGMANAWCQLRCSEAGADMVRGTDPVILPKAQKNAVELNGIRNCHVRDGSAVSRYLAWIESEVSAGRLHDEATLADQLESFRRELNDIHDLSFDTISAAGENAARRTTTTTMASLPGSR